MKMVNRLIESEESGDWIVMEMGRSDAEYGRQGITSLGTMEMMDRWMGIGGGNGLNKDEIDGDGGHLDVN